ncbi:Acetylpolyamine amidohydrolase 2 [Burkholderiales bacterium 8X]|nr:Acetylpolyamine amidohydrolase 2 [Burkholderiales bacterium 8X]
MQTYFNDRHALHQGRFEMFRGRLVPCFELPDRVDHVYAELLRRALGPIVPPDGDFDEVLLAKVHAPRYLDFLAHAWDEWVALDPAHAQQDALPSYWPTRGMRSDLLPASFPARLGLFAFDAGTPLTSGSWDAARHGAACAFSAARHVAAGRGPAFALTRPPGHHAGFDFFGGYCFINNAAVAAQCLRDAGAARVAVLDIDYHHGNGTQAIFYERPDVHVASLHGDPRHDYPYYLGHADERGEGEGRGFNHNLPLPRGTGFETWRQALYEAIGGIARTKAEALVVSLGVDTFEGDPVAGFGLRSDDYLRIGEDIRGAGLPTVFVFEGGYAVAEIGVNAVNVLAGFLGA